MLGPCPGRESLLAQAAELESEARAVAQIEPAASDSSKE
jgi:hypothetical protein